MQESGNNSLTINRSGAGVGILFAAVFADAFLNLSAPGAVSADTLIAFFAFLLALALLFVRGVAWSAGNLPVRLPAALALALYGLHPSTAAALKGNVNVNLIAALAGVAAGITICRWSPANWWLRWACLVPAIPCILLDKVGAGFAPLLAALVWLSDEESGRQDKWRSIIQCWPSLVISLLAGFLHRVDAFHPDASIIAFAATAGSFFAPFAGSTATSWTTADGLACLFAVVAAIVAATGFFRMPAVSFGLFWFFIMAVLAPIEPLAAFPGLALAVMSALTTASMPLLGTHIALLEKPVASLKADT